VRELIIGGRRNCTISADANGVCTLVHLGHSLPIEVNGRPIIQVVLADGDLIHPGSLAGRLCFRFRQA
jgi:hypothetical protein